MLTLALLRLASRTPRSITTRTLPLSPRHLPQTRRPCAPVAFSTNRPLLSSHAMGQEEETFEEFTARYEKEFDNVEDVFELQRNLNNAFAYDLVPSPAVIEAALRAARRVNDYPTAVRIFEGIKAKVENKGQYDEYLRDLEPIRRELGVNLKEELYPNWEDWRANAERL